MDDRIIRAEDNGRPLLDADDQPFAELTVDSVDTLMERGVTVAELTSEEESWRFGHVIVDEAQDLTPMQWRMITRRASGGSMTIVGDLAQRSIGEPGTWADHLPDSIASFAYQELTINYRSPAEVNRMATAVLAELAPDLAASQSIRSVGHDPILVQVSDLVADLEDIVRQARDELESGKVAVIGLDLPELPEMPGVQILTPWQSKGLEFDSVVLVEPARMLDDPHGLSLLFVAITRTTNRLLVLHQRPLPRCLANAPS